MTKEALTFAPSDMRRERLHEQIADKIQRIIAVEQRQPGSQLPPERELAKQLGVNRMTVRQGLYLLEQRGLIDVKVGSGSYLTRMAPAIVAESIGRYVVFGDCSHRDLVTVRQILEPETAALAATHATSEDLARLKTLVEQIEDSFARADIPMCVDADTRFHMELAVATKNKLLIAFMSGLEQVMHTLLQLQIEAWSSEARMHGHRLVYDAVASRDAEQARKAMRTHIEATRAYFWDWMAHGDTLAEASGA